LQAYELKVYALNNNVNILMGTEIGKVFIFLIKSKFIRVATENRLAI